MKRNDTGAIAPSAPSLSPLAKRFDYVKKHRRREDRARRKVTEARLREAEAMLGIIIDGADLVAITGDGPAERPRYRGVYLMMALNLRQFDRLCELGAELVDDEPNGDLEPSVGMSDLEGDDADFEPSLLGCTGSGTAFAVPGTCDGEECVPLLDMVEKKRARSAARRAAFRPEDAPEAIRNGAGKVVVRKTRFGLQERAEEFQRRMRERRAS